MEVPVRSQPITELISYLSASSAGPPATAGLCRNLVQTIVPEASRPLLHRSLTRAIAPQQRRRARLLARSSPLRLNLGSGASPIRGWVNVDLIGHKPDLAWDLTVPLPLADGGVEAVFSEHLLEHLPLTTALDLIRECNRLLAPGGTLRVGVPDAGAYLRAYDGDDQSFIEATRPGRPTRLLAVREVFQEHGHRSAYDFQTLALFFEASGFRGVDRRASGESRLQPCPDSEHRRQETLYVEGIKP
jgi:predicted SAM-dependent methyltransferase